MGVVFPIEGERLMEMFGFAFEYWQNTSGFEPVALIASEDEGGAWETCRLHVFKLKRGFATVYESGCSCYSSSDAEISIYENLKTLAEALQNNITASENERLAQMSRNIRKELSFYKIRSRK